MKAIGQFQVQLADGVSLSVGPGAAQPARSLLEDRLRTALVHVGEIAGAQDRGVALLFDEAHGVHDTTASTSTRPARCCRQSRPLKTTTMTLCR